MVRGSRGLRLFLCLSVLLGLHCNLSAPAWSPDGQQLALLVLSRDDSEDDFGHTIYTYDLRTRELSALVRSDLPLGPPAWSPDGRFIAYLRIVEQAEPEEEAGLRLVLMLFDRQQASHRELTALAHVPLEEPTAEHQSWSDLRALSFWMSLHTVHWHPSGDIIACSLGSSGSSPPAWGGPRDPEAKTGIQLVHLADGRCEQLLPSGYALGWSPDGRWLAYAGARELRVRALTGEEDRMLYARPSSGPRLSGWSPDSRKLYFLARVKRPGLFGGEEEGDSALRVDVETGLVERLLGGREHVGWAALFSDGKALATFISGESVADQGRIEVLDLVGIGRRTLATLPAEGRLPFTSSLSPTGEWIAVPLLEEVGTFPSSLKLISTKGEDDILVKLPNSGSD